MGALAAAVAVTSPVASAVAGEVDLKLPSIRVTQAIKFDTTPLIAGNATMVRAIITHPANPEDIENVDAILHVFVDGEEAAWSPIRSLNGPITSPASPDELQMDDHVNFLFVAPESSDVDLRVVVNPALLVEESVLHNNIGEVSDLDFECRGTVELVYVPIDYTPGGGVPGDELIEPGIGDGFLRAIYHPREWDYHRSPLPPLLWTQNINNTATELLNTLRDIRINQLPAEGYDIPDMTYGWLPGNPYSGNGRAIGIPGDAAFGNSQAIRHQRTFAHEVGHLLNEGHNSERINTIGIDVEHHLRDTQNLGQTHVTTQFDIMVGGQLTQTAFVSNSTYNQTHGDPRFDCDVAAPDAEPVELLRVSGVYDHGNGTLTLDPLAYIERGTPDPSRLDGNTIVVARDTQGNDLGRTIVEIGTTRESCADPAGAALAATSPLHVLIAKRVADVAVHRIDVIQAATGDVLATLSASPNAPTLALAGVAREQAPGRFENVADDAALTGTVRFAWDGADVDGDDLTYTVLYSPDDGRSWLPVAVNLTEPAWTFDVADVPGSRGVKGRLRVIASDGFNHRIVTSPPMAFAGESPPETYLLTPNDGDVFSQHGEVLFHGTSWDKEDGRLADDLTWSSDLDGTFGGGAIFATDTLSAGVHVITTSATDTDGGTDAYSVTIEIAARLIADLDHDGLVGFSDLLELLAAWGPCDDDFCPADLDLNGAVEFNDLLLLLGLWS